MAARENGQLAPGKKPEHFAIKVEQAIPRWNAEQYTCVPTGSYQEIYNDLNVSDTREPEEQFRYLPVEAIVMQHLTECERFPRIDSVWMH